MARCGQVLLDGGRWHGRQVLPQGWVEQATREHVPTLDSAGEAVVSADGADWAQGYGWQFWQSRHGYRGDGAYGQFCVVLPEHDVVVATTGATPDMQAVLDAVWEHVLPALASGPVAASPAEGRLSARLAAPTLPPVAAGVVPAAGSPWETSVLRLAAQPGLHGLRGAELRRDGAGWSLAVEAADGTVTAAVGVGQWAVTEPGDGTAPVAVGAGWPEADRVVVDLVFLESPHRLRLTGDLATGALQPTWHTEPLSDVSLASMQRPLAPAAADR